MVEKSEAEKKLVGNPRLGQTAELSTEKLRDERRSTFLMAENGHRGLCCCDIDPSRQLLCIKPTLKELRLLRRRLGLEWETAPKRPGARVNAVLATVVT